MRLNKKQKGFSLIELMIVVAIIGVLSAVAVPQYQNYVAKSEISSGYASLTALRSNVENHIIAKGTFPEDNDRDDVGVVQPRTAAITFSTTDSDEEGNGSIVLTFADSGNSPNVNGKALKLVRDDGAWSCEPGNDIDVKLLPKACTPEDSEGEE